MMTIIADVRKTAGVSQFELARRSGISRTRISLAEQNFLRLAYDEEVVLRKALAELLNERQDVLSRTLSELSA